MPLVWLVPLMQLAAAALVAATLAACAPAFSPARMPSTSSPAAPRERPPSPIYLPDEPLPPRAAPPTPLRTEPERPPAITTPLQPSPPITVAPPGAPSVSEPPAPEAQPAPQSPIMAPPAFLPAPPADASAGRAAQSPTEVLPAALKIALVLPLESPTFGRAAEAVAAGFAAAAEAARVPVTVIAHADGGVLDAIGRARAAGASVIVGPLLRDDVKALATSRAPLPWTIALNQLEDATPLPEHVYTLALSIEAEGRQIAQLMQAEGVREVATVAGDSGLQRRFAASFTTEWLALGGAPPKPMRLLRGPDNLLALRNELARLRVDAVLLAADAAEAVSAKPFLGHLPVYASSQVNEKQPRELANDLDGIRFVDAPWVADSREFPDLPPRSFGDSGLDRLYALGYDACHVALAFADGAPQRLELDGATGHLTLGPDHRLNREGRLMRIEDGHPVIVEHP